jgi:hypothetical protein
MGVDFLMRYYWLEVNQTGIWQTIDRLDSDNPNALHIILDSVETTNKASANITLTIHNPPNNLLTTSFINAKMRLRAGLKSALPLANQKQIGYVMQGTVLQQIPNLTSTTTTVTYKLITYPVVNVYTASGSKGSLVASLIQNAMSQAGQTLLIDTTIATLTLNNDVDFTFNSFKAFCNYLFGAFGIDVYQKQGAYLFYKGTPSTSRTVIVSWADLIGQPVGESVSGNLTPTGKFQIGVVQLPCHARGDITVGDTINLKINSGNSLAVATSNFNAVGSTGLDYAGQYVVTSLRHTLQSRDPNPESWCTTITGNIL